MFLFWLIIIIGPISNFLHECGHALVANLLKADQIKLTIGSGSCIKQYCTKRVEVNILSKFFIGGFSKTTRTPFFTKKELVLIAIGGPISSGILSIVALLCYFIFMNEVLLLTTIYNGWLALVNLIPFKIKSKQSDGYVILTTLKNEY